MLLQRTEKARAELLPGVRPLGLRERSVLLLADGRKSLMNLAPLFDGQGQTIVLGLVKQGYLQPAQLSAATPPEPSTAPSAPPPAAADAFESAISERVAMLLPSEAMA